MVSEPGSSVLDTQNEFQPAQRVNVSFVTITQTIMSAMAEPTRAHSNHQIVGSTSNTPIIVLGVLIGVMWIFVLVLAFLFWRWRRRLAHIGEHSIAAYHL